MRCSSSYTSGTTRSNAPGSPSLHARSSRVTSPRSPKSGRLIGEGSMGTLPRRCFSRRLQVLAARYALAWWNAAPGIPSETTAVKTPSLLLACCLGMSFFPRSSLADEPAEEADGDRESEGHGHLCGGEPCDAVKRGFQAFFDRKLRGLGGNGRSCADCHVATDAFQLSPDEVEARFQ